MNESRIRVLEHLLANAVVSEAAAGGDAGVGSLVSYRDADSGKVTEVTLVHRLEADLAAGKLSVESPIGTALLGAAKGDEVSFETPRGGQQAARGAVGRLAKVLGDPPASARSRPRPPSTSTTRKLSGRPAKIGGGALATKVSCPALKTEACEGELEAVLGKQGDRPRRLQDRARARKAKVRLPMSAANARARRRASTIVLAAKEIDADGRDRFVSRPTRVEKAERV